MSQVCITFSDTQFDDVWISLERFCEEDGIIVSKTAVNTVRYFSISVWGHPDQATVWISEAQGSPKRKKKLRTQINGEFNGISSADEKKYHCRAFI
jgi:hypothetical protein